MFSTFLDCISQNTSIEKKDHINCLEEMQSVFFIPLYSLTFESAFPSTLYHSCPFHSGALIVPDQALSNLERFLLSWQKNSCCQRWANSKNDNYFHSRWQLLTVLSENNCHFENWVIFDNSHFLLSLRQITSFNRSKLEQMELAIIPNKR